jgi:site-specific DNA-methyltransferase (adenine-specific)
VTDPPYGLSFMGKDWDHGVPGVPFWAEAMRVLKPGGHLLAFGGTRTFHRLAVAIEDAGFEIRDCLSWLYGTGFPKSHNVGKAVDKIRGNERQVMPNPKAKQQTASKDGIYGDYEATTHITKGNSKWEGWGTALKPAWEPIIMARNPLGEKTIAANVLKWGTGAINVDATRIKTSAVDAATMARCNTPGSGRFKKSTSAVIYGGGKGTQPPNTALDTTQGRWPANLVHDGSDKVLVGFPGEGDKSAARFFYCAKASNAEREAGLGALRDAGRGANRRNHHPTVKPVELMRWLVRLVAPPEHVGGRVIDPFCGSGSTGVACAIEDVGFVGCEIREEYAEIARERIAWARDHGEQFAEAGKRERERREREEKTGVKQKRLFDNRG